ncbi:MAG: hypothetical protein ACYDAE_13760, partial [Steroidobacteraceae bacterium]
MTEIEPSILCLLAECSLSTGMSMGQQKGKSMKRPRVRLQERVAAVIRRHREAGKWTQDAFAAHIEMHRAQYSIM